MVDAAIPTTRAARHGLIRELLAEHTISSQEQLRSILAGRGIETTQATLSRDLMDLRATKVRSKEGHQIYSVPDVDGSATHEVEASHTKLARWCQELLIASDRVGNQLVLRTPVGAANLLGSAIDASRMEQVAGTIAGDDTLLIICRSDDGALQTQHHLMTLAAAGD